MAVTIKSDREIELMREAGKILAIVHKELEKAIKPGIFRSYRGRVLSGRQRMRRMKTQCSFLLVFLILFRLPQVKG